MTHQDNHCDAIFYPSHLDANDLDGYKEFLNKFRKQAINKLTNSCDYIKCSFDKRENIEKSPLIDIDNNIDNDIFSSDDGEAPFIIINSEEPKKSLSKILAIVIINDLGAVIKTAASYFIAYDTDLLNNFMIVWSAHNFGKIKQKLLKWIHRKDKISVYYIKPNGIADGHDGKNVFFMVDDGYYGATRNDCVMF